MKIRQHSRLCKHSKILRWKLMKYSFDKCVKIFPTTLLKWESLRVSASFICNKWFQFEQFLLVYKRAISYMLSGSTDVHVGHRRFFVEKCPITDAYYSLAQGDRSGPTKPKAGKYQHVWQTPLVFVSLRQSQLVLYIRLSFNQPNRKR